MQIKENMKNCILMIFCLFISFDVNSRSTNVITFTCEYDPNLIQKEQKNLGFFKYDEIDRLEICKTFSCKDLIEVNLDKSNPSSKNTYRLRNSWFNHQGILIDKFLMEEDNVIINTFVSQAYFLETYSIDKTSGKTKRTFYRFDGPDFFNNLKRAENNKDRNLPLYNKDGKLSLETLQSYSLEPWQVYHFEGKCQNGTGV